MGCKAFCAIPSAGIGFFFSSWLLMIFVGIVADDFGINAIGYKTAMIATIGLWLTMAPLIGSFNGKTGCLGAKTHQAFWINRKRDES